jgi:FAD/FMN-containing dehydrogenase
LGQAVSAFELVHRIGLDFLAEKMPHVARPALEMGDWSVLVEAADGTGAEVAPRLEATLGAALEAGLATDALVAQNEAQRRAFWTVRETIPEANRLIGAVISTDVALPPADMPAFLDRVGAAVAAIDPGVRANCFGHVGDGNLHYNLFPAAGRSRAEYDGLREALTDAVHGLVAEFGGSIAAEHGVGRIKTCDLARYADPTKLAAMRAIKAALDPFGVMNPGAVLEAV